MSATSPAGSPPAPSPASLPGSRKRPSAAGSAGPGAKRRKASIYSASGSAHPLRQTSFPPEDSAISGGGLRSPSVETDITQSVAASAVGSKRGRKRKSNAAGDTGSLRSGPSAKGGTAGGGGGGRGDTASRTGGQDENEAVEDDDDEEGMVGDADMDLAGRSMEAEKARYAALFEAADSVQQDRLTNFRRFHLSDGKVRRIVNQTLSQSVPKSVITAVNSYSKYFIGSLIERAIEIQRHDDLAAIGELMPPVPGDEEMVDTNSADRGSNTAKEANNPSSSTSQTQTGTTSSQSTAGGGDNDNNAPKETDKSNNNGSSSSSQAASAASPSINGSANASTNASANASASLPTITTQPLTQTTGATTTTTSSLASGPQSPATPRTPRTPTSNHAQEISKEDEIIRKIHRRQHATGREIAIGPLRPDSIREALRRLKKEGEFGGVGVEGVSTGMGIQGSRASMMGGRRLFR